MDEKRFRELFPEVEKKNSGIEEKEEEKRREEFFAHMKMQMKPEKRWELMETAEITLRKKKRRRMTVYSATAAACLVLAIVLPNLSELLKLSEQKTEFQKEQEIRATDDSAVSEDEKMEEMEEDTDYDGLPENEKEMQEIPGELNIQKENDTGKNEEADGGEHERPLEEENNVNTDKSQQQPSGETSPGDTEQSREDDKQTDKDEEKSSIKQNGSGRENSGKSGSDSKNSEKDPSDDNKKENSDKHNTSGEDAGSKNEYSNESEEDAHNETEPMTDNTMLATDTANTGASTEMVKEETAEITEDTATTEIVEEIENCTAAATVNVTLCENAVSAFEKALSDWWEKEHLTVPDSLEDAVASNTESTEDAVSEENEITKEEVEKELEAYPYLYYLTKKNNYGYYHAVKKTKNSAEGMEYLGMATICKEKTEVYDLENKDGLTVYVYGYKDEFSEILVRFQAEGVDWYYVYEQ